MPRKKKPQPNSSKQNSLIDSLQTGKKIAGLIGYVKIDDGDSWDETQPVFVKVRVLSLHQDSGCSGIKFKVEPVEGCGIFIITPCQWHDSPEDIQVWLDMERRKELCKEDQKLIRKSPFIKNRREAFKSYIESSLTPEQAKSIEDEMVERKLKLNTIYDHDLDKFIEIATHLAHSLEIPEK